METSQYSDDKSFFEETAGDEVPKIIHTVSAIALDFDFVTSDSDKSRADEIKVLIVKNKKPPRKSKEGKPGGFGLPTGQLESKENMLEAVKRETRDESGCSVKKIVGKLFVVYKRLTLNKGTPDEKIVPNEIHVFLVEASEAMHRIREVDEIDGSVEPWVSLRQVFEMPMAQNKGGGSKNPNGIYFSHLRRLYNAIESMVFNPEYLIEGEVVKQWLKPNRQALIAAMIDLEKAGLLNDFIPPAGDPQEEEEVPAY